MKEEEISPEWTLEERLQLVTQLGRWVQLEVAKGTATPPWIVPELEGLIQIASFPKEYLQEMRLQFLFRHSINESDQRKEETT